MTLVEERRPGPTGLAIVGSTLVWRRQQDIRGMSLPDGKPSDLGAGLHPGADRPISDGSILYWFSAGFDGVSAMPLSGGDVTALPIKLPAGIRSVQPHAIGLSSTSMFIVGAGRSVDPSHPETAALFSISMSDGSAQLLAKVPSAIGSFHIVSDGDSVFWTSAGLKVAGRQIAPAIYEYSLTDKTNELVHDFAPGTSIYALASDKRWLYVSVGEAGANGSIRRISKRTRVESVVVDHVNAPFLALDERTIYFTIPDDRTLSRVPKAGGAPEVIWHGDDRPEDVVVGPKYAYWVDRTNMAIMRVEKSVAGTPQPTAGASTRDAGEPDAGVHDGGSLTAVARDDAGP